MKKIRGLLCMTLLGYIVDNLFKMVVHMNEGKIVTSCSWAACFMNCCFSNFSFYLLILCFIFKKHSISQYFIPSFHILCVQNLRLTLKYSVDGACRMYNIWIFSWYELLQFLLAPMGVLAPGYAHTRPSARPPIDTSGNFPANVSAQSPSNISPNPSEVISKVSEP